MRMKLILGCLAALFFTIAPVFAQEQMPSADDIVAKIQSKLNLTQDQVTAIAPIIEKYMSKRQQLKASMEDGTLDRDTIRSQMQQLKEDEKQELSQFLSNDQLSQWKQMMSHRHNNANGWGMGHPNEGEPTGKPEDVGEDKGNNGDSGND